MVRLSFCIATFKRGQYIAETLDSILSQWGPGLELVVVDGASPDNTPEIMAGYVARHPHIRYIRETENSGVDADYDKAVGYASGEYCWLMTDDDLLAPGAVARVLAALDGACDLVVANTEVRNADFSVQLRAGQLPLAADREYGADERDLFYRDVVRHLSFIGGVIIRRAFWMGRDRASYYGSLFIHVGVIFQWPPIGRAKVIAEPLVVIRYGNAMWAARGFEIWMFMWPRLLWSVPGVTEDSKRFVQHRDPWKKAKVLLYYRGIGCYSLAEYGRFIRGQEGLLARIQAWWVAATPGWLVNLVAMGFFLLGKQPDPMRIFDLGRSRYSTAPTRWLARRFNPDMLGKNG